MWHWSWSPDNVKAVQQTTGFTSRNAPSRTSPSTKQEGPKHSKRSLHSHCSRQQFQNHTLRSLPYLKLTFLSMFFLATWSLCFRKDHLSQVTGVATLEVRLSSMNHCHLWQIKTQKKYYIGAMMCLSIYNCIHSRLNQSHKQRKWCFCGNVALFYF